MHQEGAKRYFPILSWISQYSYTKAMWDVLSGSTVGLMVIPQSIAFASIAGLPPQYGLYSAFACSFVYALMGTVGTMVIGPTTLMALMSFRFTSLDPGYAPFLSLITGIFVFSSGLFRLGFLINFISAPVTSAFTTAASLTIASKQLKNLLGVNVTQNSNLPGLLSTYEDIFSCIHQIHWPDAVMGLSALVSIIGLRYLPLKGRFKPFKFVSILRNALVVLVCTMIAWCFETPLTLTGNIPIGMPGFSLPFYGLHYNDLWSLLASLGPTLFTLPLVNVLCHIAVAKSFVKEKSTDGTLELIALGLCNIAGSFVWAMPVSASFGRTSINAASGGRTPLGGFATCFVVISALQLMMPFCAFIPTSCLASVVIGAVIFNIEFSTMLDIWKNICMISYVVTILGCLLWRLEYGIILGMGVDLLPILYLSAVPDTKCTTANGCLHINLASGLLFPGLSSFKNAILSHSLSDYHKVVLHLESVSYLDYSTIKALIEIIEKLEKSDKILVISGLSKSNASKIESLSGSNLNIE